VCKVIPLITAVVVLALTSGAQAHGLRRSDCHRRLHHHLRCHRSDHRARVSHRVDAPRSTPAAALPQQPAQTPPPEASEEEGQIVNLAAMIDPNTEEPILEAPQVEEEAAAEHSEG